MIFQTYRMQSVSICEKLQDDAGKRILNFAIFVRTIYM